MMKIIKNIIHYLYYFGETLLCKFLEMLVPSKITEHKKIPIIINNMNRLTFLKKLIEALEKRGYFNIYIIDNNSTYKPLLEYYKSCRYPIFFLNENIGHLALWKTDIYKIFIKDFYVYTDPDIVPVDNCPDDFLDYFLHKLKEHRFAKKIGFSLKIDDLPDRFKLKEEVIEWESRFSENRTYDSLYSAIIDTTFALYRPWAKGGANRFHLTYRTPYPYSAHHLPWYLDSSNLSEEELYYIKNAEQRTFWTGR